MDVNKLLTAWEESKSVRQAAKSAGVAPKTALKALITNGIYPTRRSEEIAHMAKSMTLEQIAAALNISAKNVANYLPYTKGSYLVGPKSPNALRVGKHRKNTKTGDKSIHSHQ